MEKILVVVDMQNDFIDGELGTEEARNIVKPVCEKIKKFDGVIFLTLDTHSDDFVAIWSKPFTRTLDVNKNNQFKVTEKLFVHQNNLKYIQH